MTGSRTRILAVVFALLLVGAACGGGDETGGTGGGEESTAGQPDMEIVKALVDEWVADPSKVPDPKKCPVTKIVDASEGGERVSCYDEEDIVVGLDAAIRWEFPDGAAAEQFVKDAGTSSTHYLINDNVIVDGPNGSTDGFYDPEEFVTALSEKCGCGEVKKKP
ncbi:MAG: hypothetical protein M3198_12900 [Actinomycetota bacterium]|nr:hypothetical protein [Actinomycetota bacterium]